VHSKKLTGNQPGEVCLRAATTWIGTLCYQRESGWSPVSALACRTGGV